MHSSLQGTCKQCTPCKDLKRSYCILSQPGLTGLWFMATFLRDCPKRVFCFCFELSDRSNSLKYQCYCSSRNVCFSGTFSFARMMRYSYTSASFVSAPMIRQSNGKKYRFWSQGQGRGISSGFQNHCHLHIQFHHCLPFLNQI